VATPSGFVAKGTDLVGGGPTGSIGFSEATSADCNAGSGTKSQWVGSALRYFEKSPNDASVYMLLCVTQYRTSATPTSNVKSLATLAKAKKSSLVNIPGAVTATVGPARQIFFSKGDYFVFVVALSLDGSVNATSLGVTLAHRQYAALPG
jgi:hypothetical protein